jgi:Rad3-related DNA helicase
MNQRPSLEDLLEFWPIRHKPRQNQIKALQKFAEAGSLNIEMPTGEGKTEVAMTILRWSQARLGLKCFYLVPTKTLLDQVRARFDWLMPAIGRNEHECLYYTDKPKADQVPCTMLRQCPHRVDQNTGMTHEAGATPCPYLQQKFEAMKGPGIVVCTIAFYLFTHLRKNNREEGEVVCVDEAHLTANVFRQCLSSDIADWQLAKGAELLDSIGAADEAKQLRSFRKAVVSFVKRHVNRPEERLLKDDEITQLLEILEGINEHELHRKLAAAASEGKVGEGVEQRETLRKLENLTRDLKRYVNALRYAVPGGGGARPPSNFLYGVVTEKEDESKIIKLVIKCHHVAPLITRMMPERTVGLSATIGDPDAFAKETGLKAPVLSLPGSFEAANSRIYMATDTRTLSGKHASKDAETKEVRRMVRAAVRFAKKGTRSLIVVNSEKQRKQAGRFAEEEGLRAVVYGDGVTARQAAEKFKDGEGMCLIGTAANYAQGVDLPKKLAPVIFFLKPGFPPPSDPAAQFEERRFGGARWAIWTYRVMQLALQVRGRNVRGPSDVGVTFFMSQQFRKFLWASLPAWLQAAYKGDLTWEASLEDAEHFLAKN